MNLQLTPWSFFLLFGCLQAILLAGVFAFHRRGAHLSNRIMTALLIVFAVILFDHSLRLSLLYKVFPWGLYTSDSLWYLIGPLLWLYLKFRVENYQLSWKEVFHFGPFLGFALIYWDLPFLASEIKVSILENYLQNGSQYSIIIKLFILIMMLQMLVYFVVSLVFIIRIERKYKDLASGNQIVDFIILKRIILFFGLYFLFEFSFSTFRNFSNIQNRFIENWSLVMWTLFMISLVVTVIRYPGYVFLEVRSGEKNSMRIDVDRLKRKLLEYMDTESPYLQGQLTLRELAEAIGCSANHLSYLLNHVLKTSFYDFINSYRVAHVARQLEAGLHEKLSIFGVAQASGFRSKASFYSFFKKEFGVTPIRFLEKMDFK